MSKTALVTGGSSGIGAAVVERLRMDGVTVLSADRHPDADIVLDVASGEAVSRHAQVLSTIDILVNSAGIVGPNKPCWQVSEEEWRLTLDVNLTGMFLMSRAVIPGMRSRQWGRIVNISSVAGKEGNPNLAAYSAAKAGVIGLTKSLGKELATDGVLVNAVTPAVVATPMNADTSPETLSYMVAKIPMGRVGLPSEVAELVAWLASEKCSFSTGAVLDISGGRSTY
jgi:2-dehydro-3-deoxy-L-rhamnonate dehydrogenase (NAD+)